MANEALILLDITLVIICAKVLEELFAKIKQPPLLGDLLAGILLGPTILGIIRVTDNIESIAWLGIVLLIFLAGLESSIEDLKKYGKSAGIVAVGGVAATFSLAFLVSLYLGYSIETSLFIAVILAPTSVSVTVATLMEINAIRTPVGETILGAAVADDVYAMVLFSIVYGMLAKEEGNPTYKVVTGIILLLVIAFVISKFSKKIIGFFMKSSLHDAQFTYPIIIGLIVATITAFYGLSPIIGAYFAGLSLSIALPMTSRARQYYPLLVDFVSPFFFVYAGILLDPWSILGNIELSKALTTAFLIVIAGVVGKVVGCGVAAWLQGFDKRSSLAIGVGMMPRAGVDLVIAVTGLSLGVLTMDLYFSALLLIYVTSITTPFLLKKLISKH